MAQIVYLIQRINWGYDDEWFYPDGETPYHAFADRERAEAALKDLERQAQTELLTPQGSAEGLNGNLYLTFGGREVVTSLSWKQLNDRLHTMGLASYPFREDMDFGGFSIYRDNDWWRSLWQKAESIGQLDVVWELFDRIRFFEIVEVEWEA